MKVAVIGAGAAGFFAAIAAKENYPEADVAILEKSQKILAKVKISGGGRCNVTNATTSISELAKGYPRGGKQLKKVFGTFNTRHTHEWYESRGVLLKAEADGRVFPISNTSQSVVDCLLGEVKRLGIRLETGVEISSIKLEKAGFLLGVRKANLPEQYFDKVIIATGGSPKREGLNWLEQLGHKIEIPVPSLFTFNMPAEPITKLMGLVVTDALVKIQGTKLKSNGPLLMTHWGMSGPAILKLSAFGARELNERNYHFNVQVNWLNEPNHEQVMDDLLTLQKVHPKKLMRNFRPASIPEKLWLFLLEKGGLNLDSRWGEQGKKSLHKLVALLSNDTYQVSGKTTFKEEFVTCGGVSLESIDIKTMQSRVCPNLYFAGEVMDIDGITGGYNFQAAWTTGFIAGKLE